MEQEEKRALCQEVGARVRHHRERRGLTKEALAEAVGISTQYVSDIEQGRKCMSMAIFVGLGRLLRVSLDELSAGEVRRDPAVDRVADELMALPPLERDMAAEIILSAARVVEELGREY